jgi:porin
MVVNCASIFLESEMKIVIRACFGLMVLAAAEIASAQDGEPVMAANNTQSIYDDVPQFGGPTSVGGELAEDATVVPQFRLQGLQDFFDPWFQFKERVSNCRGLQFNIDESILYQVATDSLGETEAASGLVRFYGQWEPFRGSLNNQGLLVFKAEDRHRIGTAITPFDLGFEAGSMVPTGTFFSEFPFSVTNLYWKQYFFDGTLAIAVGRIDVTDFVDPYAMMNPLTHFLNLAFSTNPTIGVPNQGLGAAAGGMLTERLYVQGGFGDANGQSTHAGFNTFFDDSEYFSYIEVGATSSKDRIYLDNVHVTLWHTDAREAAGAPEGHGVAFTAQKFLCDKWLPFFRCGFSDGDAALMQTTFSTGIGLQRENRDVAGIGLSWGSPADGTLRDQFTSELFYRFQLTQFLAVTPDVQLIVDPALNPNTDVLALFGLRVRAAF